MWDWLKVISWHQLVEWYQFYITNPFGDERADLRSALAGCAIANEIRTIAGGLGGKRLDAVQLKDLMPDFGKRSIGGGKNQQQEDRKNAAEYHRKWMESKAERLAKLTGTGKVKSK